MKKSINFWSFVNKDIYEAMDLAKKAGFEGIELALMAEGDLTPNSTDAQLAKIRAYADKIGIKLPSLASGLCWGASFTSDDPAEREEAHRIVVAQLRAAKALGADTILVIPGSVSVEFVPERPIVSYDVCWDRALDAMKRLAPIAEEYGVHIGIENVWNKFLLSPLEMRAFVDAVGSDYVGVYLDTGNVMFAGYPEQWIRILGSRIKKVHFKDYRFAPGGLNCFVDLLSGDVNWPEVMKAFNEIGYDGWAAGEMIPQYTYASDQIIYNTSASMERILNEDF